MSLPSNERCFDESPSSNEFLVICLCAEWCGTCRDYRTGFDGLAALFPDVRFQWLDIEEQADLLGDLDIENFPTVFVQRGDLILFFGTLLPHLSHLQRLIETYRDQSPAESHDYVWSNPDRCAWQADPDLQGLGRITTDE